VGLPEALSGCERGRLLASTDLDAGEVAFLLGFEELNSFTRAFQAWEGNHAHAMARIRPQPEPAPRRWSMMERLGTLLET